MKQENQGLLKILAGVRDGNASLKQKLSGFQSRADDREKLMGKNEALKRRISHLNMVVVANSQIEKYTLKRAKK